MALWILSGTTDTKTNVNPNPTDPTNHNFQQLVDGK